MEQIYYKQITFEWICFIFLCSWGKAIDKRRNKEKHIMCKDVTTDVAFSPPQEIWKYDKKWKWKEIRDNYYLIPMTRTWA